MGISWTSRLLPKSSPWQGQGCFGIACLEAELVTQAHVSLQDAGNPCTGDGAPKTSASTEMARSARLPHHSSSRHVPAHLGAGTRAALDRLLEEKKIPVCGSAFAHRSPGLRNREQMPLKLILYHLLKNMSFFLNREQLQADIWILLVT